MGTGQGGSLKNSKRNASSIALSRSEMKTLDTTENTKTRKPVYHALFVNDQEGLKKQFKPVHPNEHYHHSTIEFKPQDDSNIETGKKHYIEALGRLTTDAVDALVVQNPKTQEISQASATQRRRDTDKIPHITLSTAEGVSPAATNLELKDKSNQIEWFDEPVRIPTTEGYFDGKQDITTKAKSAPATEQTTIRDDSHESPGVVFAAPTPEKPDRAGKSIDKLNSPTQQKFFKVSQEIDKMLGLNSDVEHAIGAEEYATETSTVTEYDSATTGSLRVAAAMRAMLGQQDSAILFNIDPEGKSAIHEFETGELTSPTQINHELVKLGFDKHTIIPQDNHSYKVVVFEQELNDATQATLSGLSKVLNGTKPKLVRGQGELIGNESTPEDNKAEYEKIIKDYIKQHPAIAKQWNKILKAWKFEEEHEITPEMEQKQQEKDKRYIEIQAKLANEYQELKKLMEKHGFEKASKMLAEKRRKESGLF